MTDQELFDRVAEHLLAQMEFSGTAPDGCLYRGPNGLKCAIGCLISDDKYSIMLEGLPVDSLKVREAAGISEKQERLAKRLQRLHDGKCPSYWTMELARLAEEFGLEFKGADNE